MIAQVQILTPSAYKSWLTRQSTLINQANGQVAQLRAILSAQGELSASGNF